ncbi:MAG: glycoside hydrolase family 130 protein [Oscillospiraceae bacterium]|nr:glycoside hydrolase family 130 protein [Oscillospiraceae bacterium]
MMFKSSPVIKKLEKPVLTYQDIPYNAALIFNAGVAKVDGKYVMLFRNDYGDYAKQELKGTNLGLATSDDGIHWIAEPQPALAMKDDEIKRIYDPRLTVIDGTIHICFAMDTQHGIRGGIATTKDFKSLDIRSLSAPDNRNMVLFPEKINGNYVRLERPMPIYSRKRQDRFDIWCSQSPDLRYWGDTKLVMGTEEVPFANDKIGPAAPPIKTERGWLTTFHAVWRDETRGKHGWEKQWTKIYCAGIMLLDLNDPSKVIGFSKEPLIAPELYHETTEGFRTDVIFPGGMLLEDNGEVKIYYGAADTVECLATANVDDLVNLCLQKD